MKTLTRPMFNMGGPIKQGVMHGIREPHKHGERVGANLVGDPIYPKDKTGRAHHAVFGGLGIGTLAAISRFGPAAWRGLKAAKTYTPWSKNLGKWGRAKDIFWPRKGVTGPKMKGELYKTPFTPVSGSEKAGFGVGSYMRTNPFTTVGLASMAPQAGTLGYKGAKAGVQAIPGAAKRVADWIIPGDQSSWWKDKEPPTGVPLNPNLQNLIAAAGDGKGTKLKALTDAQKEKWADAQRGKRLDNLLQIMGYDRSKKTAIADALIDASKIVGDRGTLDPKNITQELINPIIQATSKRLDKPQQIREAVGLMMAKGEIEKDLYKWKPGTHLKNAQDMADTLGIPLEEAFNRMTSQATSLGEELQDLQTLKKSTVLTPTDIEQETRIWAKKQGKKFKEIVTKDEIKKGGLEKTDTIEIVQGLLSGDPAKDDGFYQVGTEIIEVVNGVPKKEW